MFLLFTACFSNAQEDGGDHDHHNHEHHHSHEVVNQLDTWPAEALEALHSDNVALKKGVDLFTQCVAFEKFQTLDKSTANELLEYADSIQALPAQERTSVPYLCWEVDADGEKVGLFSDVRTMAIEQALQDPDVPQKVFQGRNRWTRTATNRGSFSQGTPVTITWSIVPDGTDSPGRMSNRAPSNLIQTLNNAFGSAPSSGDPVQDAPWFEMFETSFAEWSAITGNIYVYEPNDDRASISGRSAGILGRRADVRIAGNDFGDGPGGVLAFNFFPTNGDMVIDSAGFGARGSLRNRTSFINTIAHEHGHGLGLSHVCPRTQTKLMEPFISRRFLGPQLDEIITIHELYGDQFERQGNRSRNNTLGTARNLGTVNNNFELLEASISDSNDIDYYRFRVNAPRSLDLTVTPDLSLYNNPNIDIPFLEAAQTDACAVSEANLYNPIPRQNLDIRLLGPDRTTVVASANNAAIGQAETMNNVQLTTAGDYYIEVRGGGQNAGSGNNTQLYDLNMSLSAPSLVQLSIAASDSEASELSTENTASFRVSADAPASTNVTLNYTLSGTATPGQDFANLSGTATLVSGASSVEIPVLVNSDTEAEGDETLILTLSPSADYEIGTSSASVIIEDLPFDQYRFENFGTSTEGIDPDEDFDNDGNSNLIEYAFGLDPTQSDVLPFNLLLDDQSSTDRMLELEYQEDTRLTDIEYIAESSTSLAPSSWDTGSVRITRGSTVNGIQDVKASVPVESTNTRRFLRVRVERRP